MSSSLICTCGHYATAHYNYKHCMTDLADGSLRYRNWVNRCPCEVVTIPTVEECYSNFLKARGLQDTLLLRDAYTTGYEWGTRNA